MALIIEITEGIQKGERFPIFPGATFGRKSSDVVIKDPNVSSLHAKVLVDDHNNPIVIDQKSKNGLIFEGRVVTEVPLFPDTEFIIGDTPFRVIQITQKELDRLFPRKTWQERFSDYLDNGQPQVGNPEPILPFKPQIELHFIQGVQNEELLVIGYGPRTAGFYSLDIALHEENCPEQAFKLLPTPEGAKILNCSLDKVFLNDELFESAILVSGDRIKIGNTLIKVLFVTR